MLFFMWVTLTEHKWVTLGERRGVEIGEAPFRRFLYEHLGDCSCAGRPQRGKVTALSALRHLQAILRAIGSIPPALPSFPSFVISELRDYCDFANDVCGLAPATLISRRQWIGRFLTHIFPAGGLGSVVAAREVVERGEPGAIGLRHPKGRQDRESHQGGYFAEFSFKHFVPSLSPLSRARSRMPENVPAY
jgi:hypothetical protein